MAMQFRPVSFDPDGPLPVRLSGEGANRAPRVRWDHLPPATRSLAILCEDVDAPGGAFTHWLLFNLHPSVHEIPEGDEGRPGGQRGLNGFRTPGWRGPLPPPGEEHRYVFSLIALDSILSLPDGATREQFEQAITDHVLEEESFVGTYRRHLTPGTGVTGPGRARTAARPSGRYPRTAVARLRGRSR